MNKKSWVSVYSGFGQININNGVHLQPRSIASEEGTHAALALLKEPLKEKNFSLRVRYSNVKALRSPKPNSWEVFWLFFNYQTTGREKRTNYFIFKPNGVELGKAWAEEKQEFLATESSPQLAFGKEYELILERYEGQLVAFINGEKVLEFSQRKKEQLFDQPGHVGLYTEDSEVQVSAVDLCTSFS